MQTPQAFSQLTHKTEENHNEIVEIKEKGENIYSYKICIITSLLYYGL